MSLFSGIEKTIERGFRRWTERMFGAADSNQLLLVHRAIIEEIETKIQTVARGQRVFPYSRLVVTLASAEADRRALYQTAFAGEGRLEKDIRDALAGAGCQLPRGFSVEVKTPDAGDRPSQELCRALRAEDPLGIVRNDLRTAASAVRGTGGSRSQ